MYNKYNATKWKEDGTKYGAESFNNIEKGILALEDYASYKKKQAVNMGKALKKLRTNKDVSIAMRGDSVMFGYNTITGGEEGIRRYPNDVPADGGNDGAMRDRAKADGYDGCFYYGENPLIKGEKSYEILGNTSANRTEVQIMDVMIQCLNEVFEGHITYVDKVFTGDSAIINYYRYNASGADFCMCNLGINDALAGFLGTDYVGNVEDFVYWYCRIIERELDNGTAFIIVTPVLQTAVSTYDTDARIVVDVYEKILYDIGRNYGIPVINGNELNTNFDNTKIIDFTHFTCQGNEIVGKRLAAPFIAGTFYNDDIDGRRGMSSYIGIRPQDNNMNVYGNACVDYTNKSPYGYQLLDNNDLYDTGVNRINKGLGVLVNYSLDGEVKDIYDKTLLDAMEIDALNNILVTVWGDEGSEVDKEIAITKILEKENDYMNNVVEDVNVLWRQADLFARGKGVRGSEAYKTAYNERMAFLQSKHGYSDNKGGKLTWSFYCESELTSIQPIIEITDDKENAEIFYEVDFATIVPQKNGYYLTLKTLEELKVIADELSISYDSDVTKENLITQIKHEKGYDVSDYKQSIADFKNYKDKAIIVKDTETEDVVSQSYTDSYCDIVYEDGDINATKLYIAGRGWHTVTLYSKNNTRFIAFALKIQEGV